MQAVELSTVLREKSGKSACHKIRKLNMIPATVYGGEKNINFSIPYFEFIKYYNKYKRGNVFYILNMPDGRKVQTLLKEIQKDPINDRIIHLDFYELVAGKKIRTKINVVTKGTAEGVKEGGILEHFVREVSVECLPEDLMDVIEIDVSNLKIGESIYIKDLKLKEKIKILDNPDEIILTIGLPTKEEVPAPAAVEAATPEAAAPGATPAGTETTPATGQATTGKGTAATSTQDKDSKVKTEKK